MAAAAVAFADLRKSGLSGRPFSPRPPSAARLSWPVGFDGVVATAAGAKEALDQVV